MIALEDIPEMLVELDQGELSLQDVHALCLDLFVQNEVDDVFAQLPMKLRDEIISRLYNVYNNDTPPENFLLFDSARGDHPDKLIIINKIRGWLARQPHEALDRERPR
jgi:hypothetical protein